MKERKIRIGITQGDTNGIGLEVVLKALSDPAMTELFVPVIYGSSKVVSYHRKGLELPAMQMNVVGSVERVRDTSVNIVDCCGNEEVKVELGVPSKIAGRAAYMALEAAVADLKAGHIDALVTAPINKDNIQSSEFTFPGHTEYLESVAGDGYHALMVLHNADLRVALVTTHLPIKDVAPAITRQSVLAALTAFDASLRRDFGLERPRIAVLSLNPHAGENGLIGHEEQEAIRPAMEQALDENKILSFGPYAADGFFGSEAWRHFDGVLAMYHDQGLAAFKTLAMDDGVNFTAGLPFVRTSPDHGTGYDIAGKGVAKESSMRAAIYAAIDVCRHRMWWDEAHENPLRKVYHDRGKDNVVLDLTSDEE